MIAAETAAGTETRTALSHVPVFRALTRPQMVAGVSSGVFVLNLAVTAAALLVGRSVVAILLALVIHAIAYVACLREPRIFDLWLTRLSRTSRILDRKRRGYTSYAP